MRPPLLSTYILFCTSLITVVAVVILMPPTLTLIPVLGLCIWLLLLSLITLLFYRYFLTIAHPWENKKEIFYDSLRNSGLISSWIVVILGMRVYNAFSFLSLILLSIFLLLVGYFLSKPRPTKMPSQERIQNSDDMVE